MMARIRSVHPGLWTDEAFVSVSPMARLLFIGLWTEADDIGCFEWKPLTMRMRLLPGDNTDVPALLEELSNANMVRKYECEGRQLGAVRNFCRFQRPKKPKAVHPSTPEVRTYVASGVAGSELDDGETPSKPEPRHPDSGQVPKKSELPTDEKPQVPPKTEKSPQMEDGGWRMEDGERKSTLPREPERDASTRVVKPPNPCVTDPVEAWAHLADEIEKPTSARNAGRPIIVPGGYLDLIARDFCQAAEMKPDFRGPWDLLIGWLHAGIDQDHIIETARRVAKRRSYKPPETLKYFDQAVRERR